MPDTILITGGAGFIGSHLAANHVASGDTVHVLVRPRGTIASRWGTIVHRVDLGDAAEVKRCFARIGPTIVYHLATDTGRSPGAGAGPLTSDLGNLLHLLAAADATDTRVFVRTGSIAEYGGGTHAATEDQRERPATRYAASLVAAAHYCRTLQASLSFPVLTARLALTYGPGQSDQYLLPTLIGRLLHRLPVEVKHPGHRRDLVHVDDIVGGLRALAASGVDGGEIVNLSSGVAPPMTEVAALVCTAAGADPSLVKFGSNNEDGVEPVKLCASPSRAHRLLGWRATLPLDRGITATVEATRMRIPE